MSSLHLKTDNHSPKGNNKGFYIALGVCLIAIGVAAWTTYDSVVKYANPEETTSSQAAPTGHSQSGVYPNSQASTVESQKPASSSPQVSSKVPDKASSKPAASSTKETKETAATPTAFVYPVGETVTKNFSGDNPIFSDTMQDWRVHSGTDFSAKIGDAVKSINAGKVKDSYKDDNLGNVLVIEHNDKITAYYCGLGDTLLVKKGDTVKSGQKIGSVNTVAIESAEKPHLHLEIKKSDKLIDPMTLFK